MTPHLQRFDHDPEAGIWGDCYRTSVACILDVDPDEIPHVHRELDDATEYPLHGWLAERGMRLIGMALICESLPHALRCASSMNKGVPFILTGKTQGGGNHAVVCRDGEIIHNPAPYARIVGPVDDECWYVEFIGRAFP